MISSLISLFQSGSRWKPSRLPNLLKTWSLVHLRAVSSPSTGPWRNRFETDDADHKSAINSERSVVCGERFPIPLLVSPQSSALDVVKPFSLPSEAVSIGDTISWPSLPTVRNHATPLHLECPFVRGVSRIGLGFCAPNMCPTTNYRDSSIADDSVGLRSRPKQPSMGHEACFLTHNSTRTGGSSPWVIGQVPAEGPEISPSLLRGWLDQASRGLRWAG